MESGEQEFSGVWMRRQIPGGLVNEEGQIYRFLLNRERVLTLDLRAPPSIWPAVTADSPLSTRHSIVHWPVSSRGG